MRAILPRIASGALSLAGLAILVFLLAHAVPGGPAYAILGNKATLDAQGAVNLQLGLNIPVWQQFFIWCGHLAHGNLGTSYLENRPVAELLATYETNTALLYGTGLALAVLLALATGAAHGLAGNRWPGRLIGATELAFYALPGFVIGTLLVAIFAGALGWLPASGNQSLRLAHPGWLDRARHLVLPAATIALFSFAPLSRYFARGVQDSLAADYTRAAIARGIPPRRILLRHVLPNALRPLITLLGLSFPLLVSGSVTVESVFGYPGLGWLLWRAALGRDYPVIVAIVLIGGVATVAANLVADLVVGWLDPRASFE